MSINFGTLQGLTIPEGVVTQIADASGRVLWMVSGGKAVLEVEKVTSDTYAGSATYTGEQFILLDIYPKTNGTVTVTYGGLTKTITDTSGAAEPNAQQVFFGTFNGVSDEVTTPANGELTIDGDYYAFGLGWYQPSKTANYRCNCVTKIVNTGQSTHIPSSAYGAAAVAYEANRNDKLTNIDVRCPSIGSGAFGCCVALESVVLRKDVKEIGSNAFAGCDSLTSFVFENTVGWTMTPAMGEPIPVDVTDVVANAKMVVENTYTIWKCS